MLATLATTEAVPPQAAEVTPEPPQATERRYSGPCDEYRPLVERYEWDAETMLAIMQAESGCRADAIGDNYPINGLHAPSCGLLQVRTLSPSRGTCEQLKNPEFNIQKAYEIWEAQGYMAWSVLH